MATFLDVTLLGGAKIVFIFLLVYVVVWGLLTWIKPFGKEGGSGAYAIIALVGAFLSVISGTMRFLIEFVTPWFLFLILLIFFILFIIRMFGLGEDSLRAIIGHGGVHTLVIALIALIILFGLATAFGQRALESTQGGSAPPVNSGGVIQPLEPGQDLIYPAVPGGEPGYAGRPEPGQPGATDTGDFTLNVVNTLLHPKVLAVIALLLIGTFTIWFMTRSEFI